LHVLAEGRLGELHAAAGEDLDDLPRGEAVAVGVLDRAQLVLGEQLTAAWLARRAARGVAGAAAPPVRREAFREVTRATRADAVELVDVVARLERGAPPRGRQAWREVHDVGVVRAVGPKTRRQRNPPGVDRRSE